MGKAWSQAVNGGISMHWWLWASAGPSWHMRLSEPVWPTGVQLMTETVWWQGLAGNASTILSNGDDDAASISLAFRLRGCLFFSPLLIAALVSSAENASGCTL